jgi:hypothetical protein
VKPIACLTACALLAALQIPTPAVAGVYSDDLGKCLVARSTEAEKQQLVEWIFLAISLNPTIKPLTNISDAQRDAADKGMARLFESLLGESCATESALAIKYEGAAAFSQSFELLGKVAGQQMFGSPEVAAGSEKFAQYIDVAGLQAKLGIKAE